MRERHHHCAICGGPLRGHQAKISTKPRTAEFLRRQERRQRAGEGASGDVDPDSQYDSSEERTYDPEIIYDAQTGWLDRVHAIGYNPASPHLDKHVKLSILSLLPSNAMQGVHYPSRNSCTSRKSTYLSRNKTTRLQTDGRELSRIHFGWVGVHV